MLSLLLKDLMVQRKSLLFGFVFVMVFMFAFSTGGSAVFTVAAFAVAYMLMQTPCAHDDKCRADTMLNSLPVNRQTIVTAKYLSVALYVAIGSVQYMIAYGLIKLIGIPFAVYPATLVAFFGLLCTASVFASFYYPILFRFGYMKTRYVSLFLFAGMFSAGSAVVMALKEEDSLPFAVKLGEILSSQPGWLLACGVAGLLLAMLMASYCLSVRFYGRREF